MVTRLPHRSINQPGFSHWQLRDHNAAVRHLPPIVSASFSHLASNVPDALARVVDRKVNAMVFSAQSAAFTKRASLISTGRSALTDPGAASDHAGGHGVSPWSDLSRAVLSHPRGTEPFSAVSAANGNACTTASTHRDPVGAGTPICGGRPRG